MNGDATSLYLSAALASHDCIVDEAFPQKAPAGRVQSFSAAGL